MSQRGSYLLKASFMVSCSRENCVLHVLQDLCLQWYNGITWYLPLNLIFTVPFLVLSWTTAYAVRDCFSKCSTEQLALQECVLKCPGYQIPCEIWNYLGLWNRFNIILDCQSITLYVVLLCLNLYADVIPDLLVY